MVSLREFARGSDRPQTMAELIPEEEMYQGDQGNTREFIEEMRERIKDMKTERGGIAFWRRLKPRPPKTILEEAQPVLDEMRQHGPDWVATLNEDGSITPKPIIGYVEKDYPRDQPKPRQGTPEFYKRYAMPVTGEHRVANPGHISNEKWNEAGRICTNLYRRYVGKQYRHLINNIEHGDIDGMESALYHCSRKNNPKWFGKRLTERIEQMPLNIAEAQRGLCDHLKVFKELEEYVDGNSDPKVKYSCIKMSEEDFVNCFIGKLRPHLPHMTDIFDTDKRKGKDWNIKKLREYIDRFENEGWLKTEREDIVQLESEEVAQLKAENARLGTENHGLQKSHESLLYTNYDLNNDLWRANNAAEQAAEKAAKQTEEAAEEKAKWAAVEKAQTLAAEKAKWQAEEKAKKEAAEKAKKEAEEKAKKEAEEKAKKEAEEKAKKEAEKELRDKKEEEKQESQQHREQQEQQQRRLRKEQKKQKKLERVKKSKKCLRGGSREASDLQNPWKTDRFMHTEQQVQQVDTAERDRKDEEQQEQPGQKEKKKRKRGNRGKGHATTATQRQQAKRQQKRELKAARPEMKGLAQQNGKNGGQQATGNGDGS
jgi:hypothetical protein